MFDTIDCYSVSESTFKELTTSTRFSDSGTSLVHTKFSSKIKQPHKLAKSLNGVAVSMISLHLVIISDLD